VSIPVFAARHVYAAVDPSDAVEAVREAFVAHARGEWLMPSKVYVPVPPDGDFRAMPARGGGYSVLKWVTSFPRNPERGLPTVSGIVLLSDSADGRLLAELDAGALTALRTGAAAVLAAETLGMVDGPAAVVGCGVNGRAVARTFWARGREVLLWDADAERAAQAAEELGARAAGSREEALAADVVATVTPGSYLARLKIAPGVAIDADRDFLETEGEAARRIVAPEREIAESAPVPTISPKELRQMLDRGDPVTVLDVRNRQAYTDAGASIPGSVRIAPHEIPVRYQEIPRDRLAVAYCT